MRKEQCEVARKLSSKVFFWLCTMCFQVVPPYRDSRQRSAPKPGKEKQKSYDYRSAILMIHRFQSFPFVFIPLMRKIWREVTRKIAAKFETWAYAKVRSGEGSVGAEKPQFCDEHVLRGNAT